MITSLFVFLSIVLQVMTATIAIRHFKLTKFNLAWVLISLALVMMAMRRLMEFLPYITNYKLEEHRIIHIWLAIVTSILFFSGLLLIKKLFKHIKDVETSTRAFEERLLRATHKVEENERSRLAKEIHDGLGPLLSAIKMSVSAMPVKDHSKEQLDLHDRTKNLVDEAIKSIKEVSNKLSPHILEHFGLQKAIEDFLSSFGNSNIEFQLNSELEDMRLRQNLEIVAYRIVCELVNNTIKHSCATKAVIELKLKQERLHINYTDNGIGFAFNANSLQPNEKGMGIYNIVSRVKTLNGEVNFSQQENKNSGIFVQISLPL